MQTLEEFVQLLDGDLELFGYEIKDLTERYGKDYTRNATFILTHLEQFAAHYGDTLLGILRLYSDFTRQVVEDNKLFARTGHYENSSESDIEHLVSDPTFQLHYLYFLTLSSALLRNRYEVFRHYRSTVRKHLGGDNLCLEIGGGNCIDAMFLSDFGRVDVFERNEMSVLWQKILGLENKVNLNIANYDFEDRAKYDFVTMIELLEHVSEPSLYLKGMHTVLKHAGCAYLTFALRMPQVDHLFLFDSIEQCQGLLSDSGFSIVEDFCTINTHQPFAEEARWTLANDPRSAVTYCCFVKKHEARENQRLIDDFNDGLDF
jgi:SAM-dependent methyltransferase